MESQQLSLVATGRRLENALDDSMDEDYRMLTDAQYPSYAKFSDDVHEFLRDVRKSCGRLTIIFDGSSIIYRSTPPSGSK